MSKINTEGEEGGDKQLSDITKEFFDWLPFGLEQTKVEEDSTPFCIKDLVILPHGKVYVITALPVNIPVTIP